jgi:hypothetical protein
MGRVCGLWGREIDWGAEVVYTGLLGTALLVSLLDRLG